MASKACVYVQLPGVLIFTHGAEWRQRLCFQVRSFVRLSISSVCLCVCQLNY